MQQDKHLDVLIVGAGISGIGAAAHMVMEAPEKTFAIYERRTAIGGTWDLFKYPGIRSDSDMYTLGYDFKPWMKHKVLADGPSIKEYLQETASEYGLHDKIHYGQKITNANWDSGRGVWTITSTNEATGETEQVTAGFVIMCTGYYSYDNPYMPDFAGKGDFKGTLIHPQHWPENLDYKGKKVVVIGSGATAVTIVPSMADDTAHITMLQRTPTYYASVPATSKLSKFLSAILPDKLAFSLVRTRNIWFQRLIWNRAMNKPEKVKKALLDNVEKTLDGAVDMKHFEPDYNPWDQRLCAIPDNDLLEVLKAGKASIVTDHIDHFTENGIQLKSGEHLDADIIISATGLQLELISGVDISVDGEVKKPGDLLSYKSLMLQDLPNLGFIMGYVNASWTLKVDIAMRYFIGLMNMMKDKGVDMAIPRPSATEEIDEGNIFGALNSGYVQRANGKMPKQGKSQPWRVAHDYLGDKAMLTKGPIDDAGLEFAKSRRNSEGDGERIAAE